MTSGRLMAFPPFRIDAANQLLWRNEERIELRPKAFAVLQYLADRPGRLVTKQELLDTVWTGAFVTEEVLKGCIREIRAALGDDAGVPRFIETKHRRGYRFIAEVHYLETGAAGAMASVGSVPAFVERENALQQLEQWFRRAQGGEVQIVFITGEPGIGKTTMVEAFVRTFEASPGKSETVNVARGQCLELHGSGEPYMPVFDALEQLCRGPARERLLNVLQQYAPTWLVQMPALTSAAQRQVLEKEILGATRQRMIREMAAALEAFASEVPLILVLEDLHWSDPATVDLLSALARRRQTRLMLIGTYRPVEMVIVAHALRTAKQDMEVRRLCHELPLNFLTEEGVARYLGIRFGAGIVSREAAREIHRRTDGNPLFVVSLVDHLVRKRAIGVSRPPGMPPSTSVFDVGVPETLRQLVEKNFEDLPPAEQSLMEAASAAGPEFDALVLAGGLGIEPEEAEQVCERLARGSHFLHRSGTREFPSGTVSAHYRFRHSLYQEVLYSGIPPSRRLRLHQRIGECLETMYGARASEIAAELAAHFEEARDFAKAIHYLNAAASNAARRFANAEAAKLLDHALCLLGKLCDPVRTDQEIAIREHLGHIYRSAGEMAKAAVHFGAEAVKARQAGRRSDEVRSLVHASSSIAWSSRERCLALAAEALEVSHDLGDGILKAYAQANAAFWDFMFVGWDEAGVQACAAAMDAARRSGDGWAFGLFSSRLAWFQSLRSRYREACACVEEGVQLSLKTGNAFLLQAGYLAWAWALLHLGEWGQLVRVVGDGLTMTEKNGHERYAQFFRNMSALLHIHAFDFASARDLCAAVLRSASGAEEALVRQNALVLLGVAEAGLHHVDEARQCFSEIREWQHRQRIMMDWIWKMPLQFGVTELALFEGDLSLGREEAQRFLEITGGTAEKTWLALAWQTSARVAMSEGKFEDAAAALAQAASLVETVEAPVAAWRVHASLAELARLRGQRDEARRHQSLSTACLDRLAASLENCERLRQTLLAAGSKMGAAARHQ